MIGPIDGRKQSGARKAPAADAEPGRPRTDFSRPRRHPMFAMRPAMLVLSAALRRAAPVSGREASVRHPRWRHAAGFRSYSAPHPRTSAPFPSLRAPRSHHRSRYLAAGSTVKSWSYWQLRRPGLRRLQKRGLRGVLAKLEAMDAEPTRENGDQAPELPPEPVRRKLGPPGHVRTTSPRGPRRWRTSGPASRSRAPSRATRSR